MIVYVLLWSGGLGKSTLTDHSEYDVINVLFGSTGLGTST